MTETRRLGTLFAPPPSCHEGFVCSRGFRPGRGFLFLIDEKEQTRIFLHATDAGTIFGELRPRMRVAFATFTTARGLRPQRLVQLDATAEGSPSPGPRPMTRRSGRYAAGNADGPSFRLPYWTS